MGRKGKSKNARASLAGERGEHKSKTEFSGKFAQRMERRAAEKEEKKESVMKRQNVAVDNNDPAKDKLKEPHSFVIHSGEVGKYVKKLVTDFRHVMEPNTASKLKVLKRNNIRDFVTNGAVLGVTHMMVFTRGELTVNLRVMRLPQGPTLTFRVREYTLTHHVLASIKKPCVFPGQFAAAPLVVLSGFKEGQPRHLQLVQSTFQNLFPTINVDMLNLNAVRRCLMVRYNEDDDTIDIRHYAIKTVPTGVSKSAKKLMQSRVPDLSKYKDIADYFIDPGHLSDSGMEEEAKEVNLAQDMSRGCEKGGLTNIRLIELGPRMTLDLLKVEQDIDEGEVLYHKFVTKSAQEISDLKKKAPLVKRQRERRRKDTEHRIIRKLQRKADERKGEEEEMKQIREAAARKQAMATGQTEEVETDYKKDNEVAANREYQEYQERKRGGGEGQNETAVKKRRGEEAAGEEEQGTSTGRKFGRRSSSLKVAHKSASKRRTK